MSLDPHCELPPRLNVLVLVADNLRLRNPERWDRKQLKLIEEPKK